jgi:HAD superfamily phosphatase
MSGPLLVLDMDGVLVDSSKSYREAIKQTVEAFTSRPASYERIDELKSEAGSNNDWDVVHRMLREAGKDVPYQEAADRFQKIFLGDSFDGLVLHEQWLPIGGLLEDLELNFTLTIFTGRLRAEAEHSLNRFAPMVNFERIITHEDVEKPKPAPDGLHILRESFPDRELTYIGDSVDDALSAKAAGVRFIGICDGASPLYEKRRQRLQAEGAITVIESINEIEPVLQEA